MIPSYKSEICTNCIVEIVFSRFAAKIYCILSQNCHAPLSQKRFFFLGSTGFLCVFQLLQTRFNVYILLYQSSRARLLLDAYQDTRSKRTPAQRVDSDTPPLTHRLLLSFFFLLFQSTPNEWVTPFCRVPGMLHYFGSPRCFSFLREMFTVNSCLILL